MTEPQFPDYYEILQVSSQADHDTIERVYRHLAKRYHPDNRDSGRADLFTQLVEAHRVLADPEKRARYDVQYDRIRASRWRIFDQEAVADGIVADRRMHMAILGILYTARRNDAEHAGLGILDLERLLGCPSAHMKFHLWYLKERGFIQRLENGMLAITVSGVDHVVEAGGPLNGRRRLNPGSGNGQPASG